MRGNGKNIWEEEMLQRHKLQKTILVVNSDVEVLVLMNGILHDECRVLLAADVAGVDRLLSLEGISIDMVVMDGNVLRSKRCSLVRRITETFPQARLLFTASSAMDGVVRLRGWGAANHPTAGSILQRIRVALVGDQSGRNVTRPGHKDGSGRGQAATRPVTPITTQKVMAAGQTID